MIGCAGLALASTKLATKMASMIPVKWHVTTQAIMRLHAFHSTHSGAVKISIIDVLVYNSFKYISKQLQIIEEELDTFAHNTIK